jgi:hypothetical protein
MEHDVLKLVSKMNASMEKHAALKEAGHTDSYEAAVKRDCPILVAQFDTIFDKNMKGELDLRMLSFMTVQAKRLEAGQISREDAYTSVTRYYSKATAAAAQEEKQQETQAPARPAGLSYADYLSRGGANSLEAPLPQQQSDAPKTL